MRNGITGFAIPALVVATWFGISAFALGGSGYVAAVGNDGANCYVKIALINDLGGTPSAAQTEIDVSGDFTTVNDVAWLSAAPGQPRRLAVLGNCNDFVAQEWEPYGPGSGWWEGDTHHLTGDIKIYDVGQSLAVSELGLVSLNHTFDTAWGTMSSVHRPLPESLRFHVAALGSGGFVVQGMANRVAVIGGLGYGDSYNRLVGFDNTGTQRVAGNARTSYLGDDNNYDVAGIAAAGDGFYSAVHVRAVTGGSSAGIVNRGHIDWDTGFVFGEDLYGSLSGCYYMSDISPLAAVDGHVMESGVVISDNGQASYNAPSDFADGDYLNNTQGWGNIWTTLDETMGIDSQGGGMYVVLRRADTNDLFSLDTVTGDYTDESFSFTWSGSPWTIVASDGNAMSSVPEPSTLALAAFGFVGLFFVAWRRYHYSSEK